MRKPEARPTTDHNDNHDAPATIDQAVTAADLDLRFEDQGRLEPWGFFAVAAHGPFDAELTGPPGAEVDQAVWEAVKTWENLYQNYDFSTLQGRTPEVDALAKAINGVSTDPFYCVEPERTYPIAHIDVVTELEERLKETISKDIVHKQGAETKVTPQGKAFFINSALVVVTYQTSAALTSGSTLETNSMAILKQDYQTGKWQMNVISNLLRT